MSGTVRIPRDLWSNPSFKDEPATLRGAFLILASMGRIVRVTVGDLSKRWGVAERRAVQMVSKLEKSGMISVSGSGRCRLICIESDLVETCGFMVCDEARYTRGAGASKWRGPSMPKKVRDAVLKRDRYTCAYCGCSSESMHVDHIKPVAKGGTDAMSNLTAACAKCNLSKGSKTLKEWKGSAQ